MGRSSSRGGTASGNFIGRQSSNLPGKGGGGTPLPPRVAAAPASSSTAVRPPPPPPMRGAAASGNCGASNHSSNAGKARSAASLQGGGNDGGGSAAAVGANPCPTLSGGRRTASMRPSRRAGTRTNVAKEEAQAGGSIPAGREDPSGPQGRTPEEGPCFAAPPVHNAGGGSDGATAVCRGGAHGSSRGGSGSGSRLVVLDAEGRLVPVQSGGGSSGFPPHPIAPGAPLWSSAQTTASSPPGGFGGNIGNIPAPGASQWGTGTQALAGFQPGGFDGGIGGGGGRLLVRDAEGRLVPVAIGDPSIQPSSAMLGPPAPHFSPAATYCAAPPAGAHQVAAPWSGVHVALVVAVVFVVALNMAVVMYMLLLRCVKGGHHVA